MEETMKQIDLKEYIRDIPDFPKEGIIFKDITTLLQSKDAFKKAVDIIAEQYQGQEIDVVVGIEARGFIFGGLLAYKLGAGFVPVRKKGKLPYKTKNVEYELEYGTDVLEVHEDAIRENSKVLIIDDLLATGGTVKAVCDLVGAQKADIKGIAFLIELEFLKGREKLKGREIYSVLKY